MFPTWAPSLKVQRPGSGAYCLLSTGYLLVSSGRLVEQMRLLVACDAAEQKRFVEELREPVDDGVARLVGHARAELRLAFEECGQAFEERAAARQDEPAVVEVGGDLGLQLRERAVDD